MCPFEISARYRSLQIKLRVMLKHESEVTVCGGAACVILGARDETSDLDVYVDGSSFDELLGLGIYPIHRGAEGDVIELDKDVDIGRAPKDLDPISLRSKLNYGVKIADVKTLYNQKLLLSQVRGRSASKLEMDKRDLKFLGRCLPKDARHTRLTR